MKTIRFASENFQFWVVKFSIYLNRRVFVMMIADCAYVRTIQSKAWQRINIMRKLKFILDRQSSQAFYFSFIWPLLEYADVVSDNCTQFEANELEKKKKKKSNGGSTKVTEVFRLVSIDSLRTETGWKTLASNRKKHKILLFKMKSELSASYLLSHVPPSVGANYAYNLRNANNVETVLATSQLYYFSSIGYSKFEQTAARNTRLGQHSYI